MIITQEIKENHRQEEKYKEGYISADDTSCPSQEERIIIN